VEKPLVLSKDQLSWLFKLKRIGWPICTNDESAQLHEDPIVEEKDPLIAVEATRRFPSYAIA